jgi:hypothetical protein
MMFAFIESDAAMPTLGLLGFQRPRITSPTAPLLLVAFLAYVVSSAYVDIFSATIKTIIFSHAADLELNGQLGNYVMSEEFQAFMGAADAKYKSSHSVDHVLHAADEPVESPAGGDAPKAPKTAKSEKKQKKQKFEKDVTQRATAKNMSKTVV